MLRRPTCSRSVGTALLAAFLVAGLILGPSTAAAQDASPSVDLTGTSIAVDGGETSTVTAEYQFEIGSAGSGENELASISGTMWQLPDREIGDISATVDGESVDASVTEEDRHLSVSVPVADVSDGDTVTVTLEYEVAGPAGDLRVPLWVPEYSTPGQANVVDATLTLPEGTTVSGSAFPSPTAVDGNTATYELLHVPGFVAAEYGESGPGILSEDTLYSLLGVVVIVGVVVGGLAIDRKTA
ncbi:hypothetical protein SY89_01823 [Halolamina pelagica]|uniref:Uncharacterized protein n=1 Tax=Halolamina pelagica TaxID=699431 RepID=A0A0P7HC54_9EURY|nr:hypothetical protein SY89_01823 [Halolamina pelagica]